jgi:hypothetical protein
VNYFTGSLVGDTSVDNVVGPKYVNAARFQHQVWDEYNTTFDKLTRENEDAVDNLLSSANLQEVIIQQFSIPVTVEKILCLRSKGLLNDEVINFYFEMLQNGVLFMTKPLLFITALFSWMTYRNTLRQQF